MRKTTIGDLCELTGYSRDQLRGLTSELPRFSQRSAAARVARVYSNHDVLVLVLLCHLETQYGLRRAVVASFCEHIAETLAVPRSVSIGSKLVLHFGQMRCDFVEGSVAIEDGVVVALDPVFTALDSYLVPVPLVQREVGFTTVQSQLRKKVAEKPANTKRRASK